MNDSHPLVSVIIPAFNRESLIEETILSVKNQTYSNWECIVVDDGSIDRTRQIVENFSKTDFRVRFLERDREPKGAPTCRNIGVQQSRGKFIIFLDSDDLLKDSCLETRVSRFSRYPYLDFIVFPQLVFSNSTADANILINIRTSDTDIIRFLTLGKSVDVPWITAAPIWKRESLIESKLIWNEETKGFQDVEFHLEAVIKGLKYIYMDSTPDCYYRIHDGPTIGNKIYSLDTINSTQKFLLKIYEKLQLNNMTTDEVGNRLAISFFYVIIKKELELKKYSDAVVSLLKLRKSKIINYRTFCEIFIYIKLKSLILNGFDNKIERAFNILWRNGLYKIQPHNYMQNAYK